MLKRKMKKLPTDLKILNTIYNRYYQSFAASSKGDKTQSDKVYLPVDIKQIAEDLKIDPDILFGRLYFHLEKKYGYKQDDRLKVSFFTPRAGNDKDCVNFPLLASVLAALKQENRKYRIATSIAVISLIISIVSILISIVFRSR